MASELVNSLLYEVATFLYEEGVNCELVEAPRPAHVVDISWIISFSHQRPNGSKVYANISIYDGELRVETVRIPLASPTAFDELLYFIKNGVTMAEEK
jgi:hypothetical protein